MVPNVNAGKHPQILDGKLNLCVFEDASLVRLLTFKKGWSTLILQFF